MPGFLDEAVSAVISQVTVSAANNDSVEPDSCNTEAAHQSARQGAINLRRIAPAAHVVKASVSRPVHEATRKSSVVHQDLPSRMSLDAVLSEATESGSFLNWVRSILTSEGTTGTARIKGARNRMNIFLEIGEKACLEDGTLIERHPSSTIYRTTDGCVTTILANGFCETLHPLGWRAHRNGDDGEVRIFDRLFENFLTLDYDNQLKGNIRKNAQSCNVYLSAAEVAILLERA